MRSRLVILCFLLAFALPSIAFATQLPPDAMQVFDGSEWEGYTVAALAGYDGNKDFAAQYAVLMKKGDHNVLCILEKEPGQREFEMTVQTDRAVWQGDSLPNLLIDTGGDALFYTYRHDGGDIRSEQYSSVKTDGEWGPVGAAYRLPPQNGRYPEVLLSPVGDALHMRMLWTDENDNIIEWGEEAVLDVYGAQPGLSGFDIGQLMEAYQRGTQGLSISTVYYDTSSHLPESVRIALPEGHSLLYGMLEGNTFYLLADAGNDTRYVYIFREAGDAYQVECVSAPLPVIDHSEPSISCSGDMLYIHYDGALFSFRRSDAPPWELCCIQAMDVISVTHDWVYGNADGVGGDRYLHGAFRFERDLSKVDLAGLPRTLSEAYALVDTDGYAMVKSDKPTDRLHLRSAPSTDAASLGRYYSGTPVRILEDEGDWAKVSVADATGYMMKKYLAFGQDMLEVPRWFLSNMSKRLTEEDARQGVSVYARPDTGSETTRVLSGDQTIHILATVGNDWYHILLDDGFFGYVQTRHFWDGNG